MTLFGRKIRVFHIVLPVILVLLFFAFTGRGSRRAPWYEEAFWRMLSPPQRLCTSIDRGLGGLWHRYADLVDLQQENDELRSRLLEEDRLRAEVQEVEAENARLRTLLAYRERFRGEGIVARVIANDPRAEFKSILIDRGTEDGIEPLMPVMGPRGLVGKVGKVAAHEARVILITDPNSAVDVMLQRSRVRGMVVGAAWHTELKAGYYLTRLEYLLSASDVLEGDAVATSGLDGIFPAGLPVGTVTDLRLSRYGIFRDANVIPFEEMAELQEVLVLVAKEGEAPAPR